MLTIADAELLMLPVWGPGEIIADPAIQQRVELDSAKLDEYVELYRDGHDLGRLVVFQVDEQWILADGFHRVDAARRAGLAELPCAVYHGSRRDAILYATSCNLHGVPLSNADKRKRVQSLLTDPEWSAWSDNAIARHCGVANSFVGKIRHELSLHSERSDDGMDTSLHSERSDNGTPPTTRKYLDRYGQVRSMATGAIGHQPRPEALVLEPEAPEAEEMPAPRVAPEALGRLSDRQRARAGPRDEKRPGSIEWCWQTLDLLKIQWQRKELTDQQFEETLQEIKDQEVWQVVPPEEPYGALALLLSEELGLDRFSPEVLAADHPLYDELVLPSTVDAALHEAMGTLERLAASLRATPQLFELHQQGSLALKDACLRFAALVAPAEPPAPALAPDTPDYPPFDTTIYVLGKLCKAGHAWGQTGKSRLRLKGRYCPDCHNALKRDKRKAQQPAVGTGA